MFEIILASQNKGKVEELVSYINDKNIALVLAPENLHVAEVGETFQQNALIKASVYYEKFKKPVLSDDSGLCLDAYPEIMGVDTANYRKELPSSKDKCEALLEYYAKNQEKNRHASFICHLCLYFSPQEIFFFEGVMKGAISIELKGDTGFGYDPIFVPDGMNETLAELPEWKKEHSHRAKSAKAMRDFFYSISRKF